MNVLAKVNEAKNCVVRKALPVTIATVATVNAMALSAFAEGESSGFDISAVTTSLTSSLSDLAGKTALACAGVVTAGLTLFALKFSVKKIVGFLKAISG